MEVLCLAFLKQPVPLCFTLGAVAGNMLYLTSFTTPTHGDLYSVDLTKPNADPQVRFSFFTVAQMSSPKHRQKRPRLRSDL